jgi:bacterioferritin (cytochrome b1)
MPTSSSSGSESIAALNVALATVLKSFPQYLRWSRPWVPPGHEAELAALEKIVVEQDKFAERLYDAIDELGGLPDTGDFPMEFTDTHDLSIDYMMREAVGYARQDVAAVEAAAATGPLAPQAVPLVKEAVQMAQRHLATIESLVHPNPVV